MYRRAITEASATMLWHSEAANNFGRKTFCVVRFSSLSLLLYLPFSCSRKVENSSIPAVVVL